MRGSVVEAGGADGGKGKRARESLVCFDAGCGLDGENGGRRVWRSGQRPKP